MAVAVAVAAKAAQISPKRLRTQAESVAVKARVEASTVAFFAHQINQRPAFILEDVIGDKAVFSGLVAIGPRSATIDAMLADTAAYAPTGPTSGLPPPGLSATSPSGKRRSGGMRFRPILGFILVLAPLLVRSVRAERKTEVDVVVDMTPEGRKVLHPGPGHPVYYLPVVGGYQELGSLVAGEKPPRPRDVIHLLAVELAKQDYLVMNPAPYRNKEGQLTFADGTPVTVPARPRRREAFVLNEPGDIPLTEAMLEDSDGPYAAHRSSTTDPGAAPSFLAEVLRTVDPVHGPIMKGMPSLILAIHWGYMNPEIEDFGAPDDPTQKVFFNQNQMLALVGGNTLNNLDLDFEREEVMQGAEQDRYFVVVSAYDFAPYARSHKKILLWQAKMSVPSNGVIFEQVLGPLVQVGGPMFGRETTRPKMVMAPVTPEGKVEVGPLR